MRELFLIQKIELFTKKFLTFSVNTYKINWSANADNSLLTSKSVGH